MKITLLASSLIAVIGTLGYFFQAQADDRSSINVAVASNFTPVMHELVEDFHNQSGYTIKISSGSTGKLYAQIINGAPFTMFLSADESRPDRLVSDGLASKEFARVYAQGQLTLLSNLEAKDSCADVLDDPKLKRLAIANPKTAPYGTASKQVLISMKHWNEVQPNLVMGENIAQTHQFVSTGSASAGFVARSQIKDKKSPATGCIWNVPTSMHKPINQKMVLLNSSKDNHIARAFWDYMQSLSATGIIRENGYNIPE